MRRFNKSYKERLPDNFYATISTRVPKRFKEETVKACEIANMTLSQYAREAIKQLNRIHNVSSVKVGAGGVLIGKEENS